MTQIVLGILRHLLTFGGGFLTSKNLASADDIGAGVGALITLVGLAFSVAQKLRARKTLAEAEQPVVAIIDASGGQATLPIVQIGNSLNPINPNPVVP